MQVSSRIQLRMANRTTVAIPHRPRTSRGSAGWYPGGIRSVRFISYPGLPHIDLWYSCLAAQTELDLLGFPWPHQLLHAYRSTYQVHKAWILYKRHLAVSPSILLHDGVGASDKRQKLNRATGVDNPEKYLALAG